MMPEGSNGRDSPPRNLTRSVSTDSLFITQLCDQAACDHQLIEQLQRDLVQARAKISGLEAALLTSRRIGAAIGIVMLSRKLTAEQAFDLLSTTSQHRNQKLRELADDVLHTGALET